ncbi:MAG TPA: DUF4962 domain-containing protein, partial [Bacteroidales bacterium]|nr:DUF4962 domain-containing protein [Bacteroidales bacterium]
MKYRLLYVVTGISMFLSLVQCKNSVTRGTEEESKLNLKKLSLVAPEAHSKQPTSLTLEWDEVEAAISYQIQLSTGKKFLSTIIDSTVDSTRFNIQGLPYDTTVYWKIGSVSADEQARWSEVWDFKTISKPDKPNPVSTKLKAPDDG